MLNSMLEHQKCVLNGVKEDKVLFRKELEKSYKWLQPSERQELSKWLNDKFNHLYPDAINSVLKVKN